MSENQQSEIGNQQSGIQLVTIFIASSKTASSNYRKRQAS